MDVLEYFTDGVAIQLHCISSDGGDNPGSTVDLLHVVYAPVVTLLTSAFPSIKSLE